MGILTKLFGNYSDREIKRVEQTMQAVLALEERFRSMSDTELRQQTTLFKERIASGETLDDLLPEAFAACREAGDRVLGLRAFPVQVLGGIILHQGRIAEMKTGEGKTLVASLPAYLNALEGGGVHIVTVNDYLARYAAELIGKVYIFLGLSVGLIVHGITEQERRNAYASDITYGTNNEFGFDYLRDNMVIYKEKKVQREHHYSIVDEVDSILIDEARTPLIISGPGDKSTDLYERADHFVRTLRIVKVAELNDKEDNDDLDGDYIVDEKARTATLAPTGVAKAESHFGLENLMDPENSTILHHINQAVRAHGIMALDIDYVVKDGEVIIVDEFTGRLMLGRRYNEGLHQAIEAKEHVNVARESKTFATITFQNYFRLYKKLSGMTGTALTEEEEFREIYKLDSIEIPTNRPMIRADHPDVIYKTEKAKFEAIIARIAECHEKGQPILVGTISIERSELLSVMLKKRGIKHEVLNAKYHDKEAEIVAQAGQFSAVTIATNMAGRGTDIMLGGNPEFLAKAEMRKKGYYEELITNAVSLFETTDEEILEARKLFRELVAKHKEEIRGEADRVRAAGGLFILGTERHESRRIDNQLRGRSGRQGDPGESQFFISLEDDLMRLFGGERIQSLMNTLGVEEDMPIETRMLSNSIESAQRKVEGRNFSIRKNVLQFDDVMNRQREIIYGQRSKVLDGEDLGEYIQKMIDDSIGAMVDTYLSDGEVHDDWNLEGLRDYYMGWLTTKDSLHFDLEALSQVNKDDIKEALRDKAHEVYKAREEQFGGTLMREIERVVLLKNVDVQWMDHIDAMEQLKRGINLRAYGQHDPVVEYRLEGFEMFDAMINSIRENTVRALFLVRLRSKEEPKREQVADVSKASYGGDTSEKKQPVRKGAKVGRNDPCPCGSGKKYKKCCGLNEQ
ncbi:MAG: preprotein translocase subunit SecA [Acetanaerobacterium sp.]